MWTGSKACFRRWRAKKTLLEEGSTYSSGTTEFGVTREFDQVGVIVCPAQLEEAFKQTELTGKLLVCRVLKELLISPSLYFDL